MILNFYLKHNLTQAACEDLLYMINTICGVNQFPVSFKNFVDIFDSNRYGSQRIYFCKNCKYDFGSIDPTKKECAICKSIVSDFFISIPIAEQIRETVKKYKKEIETYSRFINENNVADINCGQIARNVTAEPGVNYLTLSANTDGCAAFKCSTQKPLYPIFVTINNLPPIKRFSKNNLIVAGLWLSKGEPSTNLLFKYFCRELQQLHEGLEIDGVMYKVVLLQNCMDSIARAKVLCMKQFNGKFGCTVCLNPGKILAGHRNLRIYENKAYRIRTDQQTREIMLSNSSDYGIVSRTIFTLVPDFDLIQGCPPDYMHCVLLGVVRQFWTTIIDSKNHKEPYYVGRHLKIIDERLLKFKPPSSFPRNPRSVTELKKFKASEFEALLFHYTYPCLYNILPPRILNAFMELSSAIFLLLDPNLNSSTIESCRNMLQRFTSRFKRQFGESKMTFNVHLLRHLPDVAINFGALYNTSLYPYESGEKNICTKSI